MTINTFNPSGVQAANCLSLIGPDADGSGPYDFVTPANVLTQDAGGGPNGSGTYGNDFQLKKTGSFSEAGYTLGTPFSFPGGSGGTGTSVFIAFSSIAADLSSSFPLYSVTAGSYGSYLTALFKSSVSNTPLANSGSTSKLTGTAVSTGVAFTVAMTADPFGTTAKWNLYQNGSLVTGPTTIANVGSTANVAHLGGVSGQGALTCNIAYIAFFQTALSSTDVSNLHASLTGGGAFSLITTGGGVSVTPGKTDVSITGQTPTVAPAGHWITPATALRRGFVPPGHGRRLWTPSHLARRAA